MQLDISMHSTSGMAYMIQFGWFHSCWNVLFLESVSETTIYNIDIKLYHDMTKSWQNVRYYLPLFVYYYSRPSVGIEQKHSREPKKRLSLLTRGRGRQVVVNQQWSRFVSQSHPAQIRSVPVLPHTGPNQITLIQWQVVSIRWDKTNL